MDNKYTYQIKICFLFIFLKKKKKKQKIMRIRCNWTTTKACRVECQLLTLSIFTSISLSSPYLFTTVSHSPTLIYYFFFKFFLLLSIGPRASPFLLMVGLRRRWAFPRFEFWNWVRRPHAPAVCIQTNRTPPSRKYRGWSMLGHLQNVWGPLKACSGIVSMWSDRMVPVAPTVDFFHEQDLLFKFTHFIMNLCLLFVYSIRLLCFAQLV